MPYPLFLIQIIHTGEENVVARIPGGGNLETDLIELVTQHILSKGVGFFKTSTHVEQDIRDGMKEALMSLKDQTRFIV